MTVGEDISRMIRKFAGVTVAAIAIGITFLFQGYPASDVFLSCLIGAGAGFIVWLPLLRASIRDTHKQSRNRLLHEAEALNAHSLVMLTDPDARIFHANDKLLETTGYSLNEVIGQKASIFYAPEDRETFEAIRAGLDKGEAWTGETRIVSKTGEIVWTQATMLPRLDHAGKLVGTISIRTDITETKSRAQTRDLYTAFQKLHDEIHMVDPETLAFTYMNETALARIGWTDCRGKFVSDGCDDFDETAFRARIAPLFSGELEEIRYNHDFDGTPYEIRVQRMMGYSGRDTLVSILRDMTDSVEADKARAELMATISHELRTPMTAIKGAMGLLLSNAAGELPEKARDLLSISYRNADRLVLLINDVLDIEKIAAGHMEFDLSLAPVEDVVREAIEANEHFAARFDVKVVLDEPAEKVLANFDFDRTLQVLTNLMSNAAKFSPPGGQVRVSIDRAGAGSRISVSDTGPGIASDQQSRIFERFSQIRTSGRPVVPGTGLGLNIARAIMEEQGGSIGLKSKLGQGSTFYIEFPETTGVESEDEIAAV